MVNDVYGPKYHTGKPCIEDGCNDPAGTAWSSYRCAQCNRKRRERITGRLKALVRWFWSREAE